VIDGIKSRRPSILAELGFSHGLSIAVILVIALALQSTLLARVTILGVIPQILLVVIVSLAYLQGERVGIVCGFFGGLMQDLLLTDSIIGLYAMVYLLIGFAVGSFRKYAPAESVWMPVFVVAAASAVAEISYATLNIIMGQRWVSLMFTLKVASLVVLYNTLLTPFVFPLVRRIADRFSPEKVYRW
jgi:rod shape-determining protein MreD